MVMAFSGKALPILAHLPMPKLPCALARGPVSEQKPAGDTPSLVDLAGEQQMESCQQRGGGRE